MITFIIGICIGLISGGFIFTWIWYWCPLAKAGREQSESFRQQYFEANANAVKYHSKCLKLEARISKKSLKSIS